MPPKKPRKAANGYKLPDPIPAGEVITAGKKSWRLGRSVGVGGFGEIYLCDEDREAVKYIHMKLIKSVTKFFINSLKKSVQNSRHPEIVNVPFPNLIL